VKSLKISILRNKVASGRTSAVLTCPMFLRARRDGMFQCVALPNGAFSQAFHSTLTRRPYLHYTLRPRPKLRQPTTPQPQARVLQTKSAQSPPTSARPINFSSTIHRIRYTSYPFTMTAAHSSHHHHHHDNSFLLSGNKSDAGVRITRIGLYVNLGMAVSKGFGGYVFNSQGECSPGA
jgi:hypothetical protein